MRDRSNVCNYVWIIVIFFLFFLVVAACRTLQLFFRFGHKNRPFWALLMQWMDGSTTKRNNESLFAITSPRFEHDFHTFSHQFAQQKKRKEPSRMENARGEQRRQNNEKNTERNRTKTKRTKNAQQQQQQNMNALTQHKHTHTNAIKRTDERVGSSWVDSSSDRLTISLLLINSELKRMHNVCVCLLGVCWFVIVFIPSFTYFAVAQTPTPTQTTHMHTNTHRPEWTLVVFTHSLKWLHSTHSEIRSLLVFLFWTEVYSIQRCCCFFSSLLLFLHFSLFFSRVCYVLHSVIWPLFMRIMLCGDAVTRRCDFCSFSCTFFVFFGMYVGLFKVCFFLLFRVCVHIILFGYFFFAFVHLLEKKLNFFFSLRSTSNCISNRLQKYNPKNKQNRFFIQFTFFSRRSLGSTMLLKLLWMCCCNAFVIFVGRCTFCVSFHFIAHTKKEEPNSLRRTHQMKFGRINNNRSKVMMMMNSKKLAHKAKGKKL